MEYKLNIGCGMNILKGYINTDRYHRQGINHVFDLNKFPYPFEDNTFSEIKVCHILEHLNNPLKVMEEVWRISKPGSIVNVTVPFYNSSAATGDITHIRYFNYGTFDYLTKYKNVKVGCNYTTCFFDIIKINGIPTPLGKFIPNIKIKKKGIVGLRDCLAHIFGELVRELEFQLKVIKKFTVKKSEC